MELKYLVNFVKRFNRDIRLTRVSMKNRLYLIMLMLLINARSSLHLDREILLLICKSVVLLIVKIQIKEVLLIPIISPLLLYPQNPLEYNKKQLGLKGLSKLRLRTFPRTTTQGKNR
jgi:hypothetical protein